MGKKRITPLRGIKITCRICGGSPCESKHCVLWRTDIPIMQKIKQHCIDCAPDHNVDECTGRVIGSQAQMHLAAGCEKGPEGRYGITAICPLCPYRHGKNPNRGIAMTEEAKKRIAQMGARYRFQRQKGSKTGQPPSQTQRRAEKCL